MSVLDDLISKIDDPVLRGKITKEVKRATKHKKFGLVYEEHLPECTALYDVKIKEGSKVAPRDTEIKETYTVLSIDDGIAKCISNNNKSNCEFKLDDLVTVAEFGEPIYPFLKEIDCVCNNPGSDLWHTLIEADNYHALQLLEFLYAGKVDCIYIDPPYNKEDSYDWKYNCNYVDGNDLYRHSKWLSMMERRLTLAKKLLNPKDSVLIVAINELEYLHLGMLLEQLFPEATIQMISSVINPYGAIRFNEFTRTNEYIYFVMIGDYSIGALDDTEYATEGKPVSWFTFRRSNARHTRPRQFYPIYVNNTTKRIQAVGEPITAEVDRFSVPSIDGCTAVFPVTKNGDEMMWGVKPDACRKRVKDGYIKVGKYSPNEPQQYIIQYLRSGTIDDIKSGKVEITGHNQDGSIIARNKVTKKMLPRTQWNFKTHNARDYGSKVIKSILGTNCFDFPKSIYAVRDAIKYLLCNKPNALVLDFFAGSGTTLHAVNLLNLEDNGRRRCIMVTNNEIGKKNEEKMKAEGFRPGDKEWEDLGIAKSVTWPRTVCSIEGHDAKGNRLKGNYIEPDVPMADGFKTNAIYFKLGFLDKNAVALGRQFKELLPVIWMKSGAIGPCPHLAVNATLPNMMILPENKMAILLDDTEFPAFEKELKDNAEIETIYIVTNSDHGYRDMIRDLSIKNTYQLYRDYLDNFKINRRG